MSLVGQAVRKHDGDAFLTGRSVFAGDVALPGMTHAVLVRSPVAHARIAGIETAEAEAMPGVVAVLTGAQAVALVGQPQADALAAALAVRLELEPLPVVLDADEAMAEGAPLLHPEWGTNRI